MFVLALWPGLLDFITDLIGAVLSTSTLFFLREAKAAATLDHPNICTIYEIDKIAGTTFIAMAYIDGENLEQKIDSLATPKRCINPYPLGKWKYL